MKPNGSLSASSIDRNAANVLEKKYDYPPLAD